MRCFSLPFSLKIYLKMTCYKKRARQPDRIETWKQVVTVLRESLEGRGQYAESCATWEARGGEESWDLPAACDESYGSESAGFQDLEVEFRSGDSG